MNNLILFVNTFLSYILLMAIIVVVMAVGCILGLKWKKIKDAEAVPADGDMVQKAEDETE